MTDVSENCRRVLERIHRAAVRSGRDPSSIRLIAVTKTVPAGQIRQAAAAGISHIGENRLQEALPKKQLLADCALTWHFIGHLQTNKAKKAVDQFDWIHSVDRSDLAQKLDQAARRRLPVLIEVKLDDEPTKAGVSEPDLKSLVTDVRRCERLDLCGLMAIPPLFDDAERVRPYFRRLRQLAQEFGLHELSMGMSNDFEVAIEEGATMVRVGTALFGKRE
jgi:pyridoxal phosphate enzyme (YggS family)